MTKVFLILSMLTLLGAGGLAVVNRSTLVAARTAKDTINKEIKQIKDDYDKNFEKQFDVVGGEIKENQDGLQFARSKFELTDSNLKTKTKELGLEKAKEAPLDAKIAEAEKLMAEFNEKFPGIDFDALPAKIAELETQERELKAEESALRAENAIVAKKIETNTGVLTRFVEKQRGRTKSVARNASEPVVTAVNDEWGFVVLNAGKQAGVGTNSRLLVTRGGQAICKLKIVTIEPNITVANIDRRTLTAGATVLPGDKVIFQNLGGE